MFRCGTHLIALKQVEAWTDSLHPVRAKKERPLIPGRPFRDQYVVLFDANYCVSTFLRLEATGGGAAEGNAAGAFASRTMT